MDTISEIKNPHEITIPSFEKTKHPIAFELYQRILFVGGSNSGKTRKVMDILKANSKIYKGIFIFIPSWQHAIFYASRLPGLIEKMNFIVITKGDNGNDDKSQRKQINSNINHLLKSYNDNTVHKLIIFDDILGVVDKEEGTPFYELITGGRHFGYTTFMIAHETNNSVSPVIWNSVTVVFVFKLAKLHRLYIRRELLSDTIRRNMDYKKYKLTSDKLDALAYETASILQEKYVENIKLPVGGMVIDLVNSKVFSINNSITKRDDPKGF